jgi:orotate phosphoribosyltransferase
LYAVKGKGREGKTEVVLPSEFLPFLFSGSSTLIVEDILTTGSTIRSLIRLVEERGGRVVGIGTLWNRSASIKFDCPFFALVTKNFPTYLSEECPLCRKGVPLNTEVGALAGAAPKRGRGARRARGAGE